MMHSMLKVALVVLSVAFTFSNRCTTDGTELSDFSLIDEIDEGANAIRQIQEIVVRQNECSAYIKGLRNLKKQTKCCKDPEGSKENDITCTGENHFDICVYGIDVAVRYIPFFVKEFENYLEDAVIGNISSKLLTFNMTFKERLGRCIRPKREHDCKTYEVSNSTDTPCGNKSLVLEGVKGWTKYVNHIYEELNSTVNERSHRKLESRCEKRRRRELVKNERKKKANNERKCKKNKERRREKRRQQLDQINDAMMTSSTPDCI